MSEMQVLLQQAREMLASQGAPVTTENLNRAMLALSQNQSAPADGFDMNAQVERVMQRSTGRPGTRANVPRNTQPGAPVAAEGPAPVAAPMGNVGFTETVEPIAPQAGSMPTGAIPEEPALAASDPYNPTRSERIAMSPEANYRRRGTINAAQPIAEDDPTGGMYEGNQPRQAVDVDNPTGLALGLMTAPLGAVTRGATMAPTLGQRAYAVVQADRAARAAQAARSTTTPAQQASRALAQRTRNAVQESSTQTGKVDRAAIEASRRGSRSGQ